MRVSPAFFRNDPVRGLLDRAAKASAVPMSLHYHAHDGNELHIQGWGACEVCKRVNKSSRGAAACCESRAKSALLAVQQNTPVTFVCHLGFTCISIAALNGYDYVVTFGPYVPREISQEIAYDVTNGLAAIEGDCEDEPPNLDDVCIIPAGSVSALAEWLHDALQWEKRQQEQEFVDAPVPEASEVTIPETGQGDRKKGNDVLVISQTWASMAALALLCRCTAVVRETLNNRIEETLAEKKASTDSVRAFLAQAASQILEQVRRMGGITDVCDACYPGFVTEIRELQEPDAMLAYAMHLLKKVQPNAVKPVPYYLPVLVERANKNYGKEFELSVFSKEHHLAASSITRALECRINATFSEYLGRIRIENAQRLLRNTQLSASAIGARVGVSDQSNFGKLFRRYAGMSPGVYRKKYQRE